jgi:hypothetical protein
MNRKILAILASLFILAVSGHIVPVTASGQDMSLRGNTSFNRNQLSPEMRLWYDRIWGALDRPQSAKDKKAMYPDWKRPDGELYQLGRTVNAHVTALLTAFRATGDYRFLDEATLTMNHARSQLKDVWLPECSTYPWDDGDPLEKCRQQEDGHLNFIYWASPHTTNPGDAGVRRLYFGHDGHLMDSQLTASLVAAYAYAVKVNADVKPEYADAANFWTDWLENHFLQTWIERKGDVPVKPLTHPFIQFTRFYYYMYKLTGKTTYLTKAQNRLNEFKAMMKSQSTSFGTAYTWDHAVPGYGQAALGCQKYYYAGQTLSAVADLGLENFGYLADDNEMKKYARTLQGLILKGAPDNIANDGCGSGSVSSVMLQIFGESAPMIWGDDVLANTVKETYFKAESSYSPDTAPRSLMTPAYMLAYLVQRDGLDSNAPPASPSPSPQISPSPSPQLSPSPSPQVSPSPSPVASPTASATPSVTPSPGASPVVSPTPTTDLNCKKADFDNNDVVNTLDYSRFVTAYLQPADHPEGDLNGDNAINILDYSFFVTQFQKSCS